MAGVSLGLSFRREDEREALLLLDSSMDEEYQSAIKAAVERDADNRIADMHLWRGSPNHSAAIIRLVTHHPKSTEHYKALLQGFRRLAHMTVEVKLCAGENPVFHLGRIDSTPPKIAVPPDAVVGRSSRWLAG